MRRLRTRQSLVIFSIGVAVFSAFLPLVGSTFSAILIPLWVGVPAVLVVAIRCRATRCDEQPVSFLSLLLSRAPPVRVSLA
ncbi:MAG: hypothetical protein WBC51_05340 [Vicinamibacterales bacterium]|jgi:hypothetical protein